MINNHFVFRIIFLLQLLFYRIKFKGQSSAGVHESNEEDLRKMEVIGISVSLSRFHMLYHISVGEKQNSVCP